MLLVNALNGINTIREAKAAGWRFFHVEAGEISIVVTILTRSGGWMPVFLVEMGRGGPFFSRFMGGHLQGPGGEKGLIKYVREFGSLFGIPKGTSREITEIKKYSRKRHP